jgi:4'-phosphopantetheinyl transferase
MVTPDVSIWRFDLCEPAAVVERAAELLTPEERAHAERGTETVRRRRTLSRAALRIVLARCVTREPAALRFATERSGKPRLDEPGPHFSVSHSDDASVIAVTSLGPIGIDVERVVGLPALETIVARRFAPAQAHEILGHSGARRLEAFYRCWTRMEAQLKASGDGLAAGLDTTLSDPDPRWWTVAAVDAGPGLIGAVVVGGAHSWRNATLPSTPLILRHELAD